MSTSGWLNPVLRGFHPDPSVVVVGEDVYLADGDTRTTLLYDPDQALQTWEMWFEPFFQTIEENRDIVKAVSYINCNWKDHVMWKDSPTFRDIDARLHLCEDLSAKWRARTDTEDFILVRTDLYKYLWGDTK